MPLSQNLARPIQTGDDALRLTRKREGIVSFIAALLYTSPFLIALNNWGVHDWELFTAMAEIPRTIILEFGQFPFWNSYVGGGNVLFQHPEVATLTPVYILTFIFGAVVGLKLQVLLSYFLGFWGSVRFARILGVSEIAGYLFAAIYFGSSYFALHFAEGHIPFTHFCFLPWIGYFWVRSLEKHRFVIHAGAALALMILGNGGAVPLLYTSTFIGLLALLFAMTRKEALPLHRFLTTWVLGAGISAVKLIPMIIYLVSVDWPGAPGDTVPLSALVAVFFSVDQGLFSHAGLSLAGGWHEYGAFLSPVAALLAFWYLLRRFKDHWQWFALALFFLLLGLGGFAEWSPWKMLGHLPGFGQSRASGRAFQFVLLSMGMLAAFGLDSFMLQMEKENLKRRSRTVAIIVVFVFVAGLNFWLALTPLSQSFTREPLAPAAWSDDFAQTIGRPERLYNAVRANRGTILVPWLSAYHESRGLITPEREVLNEYVVSGEVEVNSRMYRGNEIDYSITVSAPGEIALGMGYDPGWKLVSHPNRDIREEQGVIAAPFEVGDMRLTLQYRTPWFWTGAFVSLLSLLGILWFWRRLG